MSFHCRSLLWAIAFCVCHPTVPLGYAQSTPPIDDTPTESGSTNTQPYADPSPGQTSPKKSRYLRVLTDEYGEQLALQTPTVRFVRNDQQGNKVEVFLESVVPIADASYYRSFARRFERYDCVLFEHVAPPDEEENSDDNLNGMQLLKSLSSGSLGLSYQFEQIDYDRDNMVHADLTAEELRPRFKLDENSRATLLSDLIYNVRRQLQKQAEENKGETSDTQVTKLDLKLLTDPDGIMKIRRLLATTFGENIVLKSALPTAVHKVLVTDRNEHAMTVLDEQLADGKRRIAFFWNAAHMEDFERRLVRRYGFEKKDTNWRNAWDLRDGAIEGAPLEGLIDSTFQDSIKSKLRNFVRRSGRAQQERDAAERAANEARLAEMEAALKALEAQLQEVENGEAKTDGDDNR